MDVQLSMPITMNPDDRIPVGGKTNISFQDNDRYVSLYKEFTLIKTIDTSDKATMRLLVTEAIELGAKPSLLAKVLQISRQTIHNYIETKKEFGIEGLLNGYNPGRPKNEEREAKKEKLQKGNKAKQLMQIRKERRDKEASEANNQETFNFSYKDNGLAAEILPEEQIYAGEYNWTATRYAGVFIYIMSLAWGWQFYKLIQGYFGRAFKIFPILILMVAKNIRSIEQLKNVSSKEGGILIGMEKLGSLPKIWELFYAAAEKKLSKKVLKDFFSFQIRNGFVSIWLWASDGHALPYTGHCKTRYTYNTQRRMPIKGQTNIVTFDEQGRIVDFAIQEGKGDLKSVILDLSQKWKEELPVQPVMVFDREGYSTEYFYKLTQAQIYFVTWDKYSNKQKLDIIDAANYTQSFNFNGKEYQAYEEEKTLTFTIEKEEIIFKLRHIYLWNKSSDKRVYAYAFVPQEITVQDCAKIILSRWGASENTFKHLADRHPLHYHPGFSMQESKNQEISNPEIKIKDKDIKKLTTEIQKIEKKLANLSENKNKDGGERKTNSKSVLQETLLDKQGQLKQLKDIKKELPAKVDAASLSDYDSIKTIDNEGKYLFDFITASVWNARKQMVSWLKEFYDEENNLVDLFYAISHCQGWIKSTKKEVRVRLELLQQPKRRAAQEQFCRKLNSFLPHSPTGKFFVIEVGDNPLQNIQKKD